MILVKTCYRLITRVSAVHNRQVRYRIDLQHYLSVGFRVALFTVLWPQVVFSQIDTSILCDGGNGHFAAEFHTGVRVEIGAARNAGATGFATRACSARLISGNHQVIVSANAVELDLDAFGVDLGYGLPIAAFQVKKLAAGCCMEYQIYSLERTPRLLRTIKGGEFVTASDVDLDGNVEIWTNDAAAVDGFEKLTLAELDAAPTVVFRVKNGELWDVSAEFQPYFDGQISALRRQIHRRDLDDFKSSDGRLDETPTAANAGRLHRLRVAKMKILEIVWDYLYSGREKDAWRSLSEVWPSTDAGRIQFALLNLRQQGVHAEADYSSSGRIGKKKHTHVFDAVRTGPGNILDVVPPQAILLQERSAQENQQSSLEAERVLDLVVDEAGKVRTVSPDGKTVPAELVEAAFSWKFIPALKNGKPVASRMRMSLSAPR
jgi:hypothetical protein